MGRPAILPRGMLKRKPPHGSKCNNCGACCYVTLCQLGRSLFHQETGPCPALTSEGCGIVSLADSDMRAHALVLIRAGEGCDARFNSEPINHAFHDQQDQWDVDNHERIIQAKAAWGYSRRSLTNDRPDRSYPYMAMLTWPTTARPEKATERWTTDSYGEFDVHRLCSPLLLSPARVMARRARWSSTARACTLTLWKTNARASI